MRKKILVAAAAAALTVGVAGYAAAEGNGTLVGPANRLHVDGYCIDPAPPNDATAVGNGTIPRGWVTTRDSVSDAQNSKALRVHIPAATTDCLYYVEAYTTKSTGLNVPTEALRNLSFEFRNTGSFEGGSPRFSVILGDNSVVFADAPGCNNPSSVRPSWSRADFTGRTAPGCSLTYNGTTYSSDGTNSAWDNFAASPDGAGKSVTLVVMVIDGQAVPASTGGTYFLDRIAIPNGGGATGGSGTGAKMFNSSNDHAVNCTTEASC